MSLCPPEQRIPEGLRRLEILLPIDMVVELDVGIAKRGDWISRSKVIAMAVRAFIDKGGLETGIADGLAGSTRAVEPAGFDGKAATPPPAVTRSTSVAPGLRRGRSVASLMKVASKNYRFTPIGPERALGQVAEK